MALQQCRDAKNDDVQGQSSRNVKATTGQAAGPGSHNSTDCNALIALIGMTGRRQTLHQGIVEDIAHADILIVADADDLLAALADRDGAKADPFWLQADSACPDQTLEQEKDLYPVLGHNKLPGLFLYCRSSTFS